MEEYEIKKLSPTFNKTIIRIPLLLYPMCSGLLSGITTSMMKGVAEMVKTLDIITCLKHPLLYILLLMTLFSIVFQFFTLNTGFKYYNQLEVVPIY
jgi:hypothetical protein